MTKALFQSLLWASVRVSLGPKAARAKGGLLCWLLVLAGVQWIQVLCFGLP